MSNSLIAKFSRSLLFINRCDRYGDYGHGGVKVSTVNNEHKLPLRPILCAESRYVGPFRPCESCVTTWFVNQLGHKELLDSAKKLIKLCQVWLFWCLWPLKFVLLDCRLEGLIALSQLADMLDKLP